MISTKMSEEEAKEYSSGPEVGNAPAYSYGTVLCLDDDLLTKLGITTPPTVGTTMMLNARVVVTSTSVNQQQDGDKEARVELQITDMELSAPRKTDASVFYGD